MSVFISKNDNDLGDLPEYLNSRTIPAEFKSLIHFESLDFAIDSSFEVMFFPSIRAAQFLIESSKVNLSDYVLACSGSQTNQRLNELGYQCEFVGKNAGDPMQVSKDFSEWLGVRKVLLPHSNLSALSISTHIPKDQLSTVEVYRTILSETAVTPCDIYVFSSPSNIQSFFSCNELKKGSKVIVWGQSSLNSLESYGHQADHVLKEGTLSELKVTLKEII
jgi:uroporphyrinogen-III synthase